MSNKLFDKYTDVLERELRMQLSPFAETVLCELYPDVNAIYRIASISEGITPRDVAIIRQLIDSSKKFIGETDYGTTSDNRNLECWSTFKSANQLCCEQNENFASLDIGTFHTLKLAQDDIDKSFWKHSESDEFEFGWDQKDNLIPISGFSTGPGSCTGVKGTSILEKYRSVWSTSTNLGLKYLHILRRISKPIHDLPFFAAKTESAVKASFVPKNSETSRLIAPQLNGDLYLQYPVESCMRNMLGMFQIHLETQQDKNRLMARNGSLYDNCDLISPSLKGRKARFCTIDLSSASDLIGIELCKYLFPIPLFNYMMACRSENMLGKDDESVSLHMMATMGNAYCFPMQSLVFCALVRAVYKQLGLPLVVDGVPSYGVYGDDIIVDVSAYDSIIKLLMRLHMKPNQKKCFSHGFFRESCGGDYFLGYDVRPVFCQRLQDDCDKYSLINRLIDWGVVHSVDVSQSIAIIVESLKLKICVPMDSGTHQGLRTPAEALPWIPKEFKVRLSASATVEREFYDFFRAGTGITTNTYLHSCFYIIDKVAPNKQLRLSRKEVSLFPFLRGGIQQSSDCRSAIVPHRFNASHFEHVNPEDLEGLVVEGEYKTVSQWDIADTKFSASYIRYYGKVHSHYGRVLKRVFMLPVALRQCEPLIR